MISVNKRLFLTIITIVLFVNYSSEDLLIDWFNDKNNRTENGNTSQDITAINSSQSIMSSTSSESSIFSSEISLVTSPSTRSTSTPSTSSSTPSTSTTPSTTSSTTPSTTPSTTSSTTTPTSSTTTTTTTNPLISTETIPSSSTEVTTNTTEELIECLKIELNAKIIFKYNSREGIDQQFEIIAGSTNGEIIQPNRCQTTQTLIIKYDLVEKTQLILGITFDKSHFNFDKIRFEYPFNRLPDDFNKDNHSELLQTCSADMTNTRTTDLCLISEKQNSSDISLRYTINDQIYCKELPLILLKNNNTSIDILLTDLRLVITDRQTNYFVTQKTPEFCPLISDNNVNDFDNMFAGTTRIWVGISYAIVGALLMFGFAFIYEKFVREKLLYNPVDRQENDI